ncbi:MAG: hypothetical protein WC289_02030 [Patescibacteria group bacterium]
MTQGIQLQADNQVTVSDVTVKTEKVAEALKCLRDGTPWNYENGRIVEPGFALLPHSADSQQVLFFFPDQRSGRYAKNTVLCVTVEKDQAIETLQKTQKFVPVAHPTA